MKNTLFIFLFLWTALAFAQTEKIKIKKEKEEPEKPKEKKEEPKSDYNPIASFDIIYGQKVFAKNFYKQLNTFDSLNFKAPVKYIGFGFSSHNVAMNPRGNYAICMYFNFIMSQPIKIHDTVTTKINGFAYNLGWGTALRGPKRRLTLGFFVGFNTGFTKFKSAELGAQINPFFSPKIAIQPRLLIKKISFSVVLDCEYDVSNPQWRSFRSSKQSESIKGFNQTGLSLFGSIGYGFH